MIHLIPSQSPIHIRVDGKKFTIWRNPKNNRVEATSDDTRVSGWQWAGAFRASDSADIPRRWKVDGGTIVFDGVDSRVAPSRLFGQFYPNRH